LISRPNAFHKALAARKPTFTLSYTWTKSLLQQRRLIGIANGRSAHRKKRVRKPLPGMILFQDGSTHARLAGQL
jgi:hypothetical protein